MPWREANEDELLKELGAADGGEDADHGGEGVGDQRAPLDAEGVEDREQVVDVGVQGGVPVEVEVVGVDAPSAGEVVEDDAVVAEEERHDLAPHRLVGAEAVRQHEGLVPVSDHPHVQDLQQLLSSIAISHHFFGLCFLMT